MATMPQIVFNKDGTWYEIETLTIEDIEALSDNELIEIVSKIKK